MSGGDLSAASVLEALHCIALRLHESSDLAQLAEHVARNARQLLGADEVVLYLWDTDSELLQLAYGENSGHTLSPTMTPSQGAIGKAFVTGEPVVVRDYPNWSGALPEIVTRGVKRMAAVPLRIGQRSVGVLGVRFLGRRGCEPAHVRALELLALPVAAMLDASIARQHAEVGEAKLNAIVDHLPCGVLVRDDQGRVLVLNKAARSMTSAAAAGQLFGLDDIGRIPMFDARSRRRLAADELPTARALRGESVVDCEVRVGNEAPEEATWMRISAVPLRGDDDSIRGAVAIFADVTREHDLVYSLHSTAQENRRLVNALHAAHQRLEDLLEKLSPVDEHTEQALARLSGREREVLARVGRGHTNRQIGADLGLSPGTVKKHVENILKKLGASDRTNAAVRAAQLGLVNGRGDPT